MFGFYEKREKKSEEKKAEQKKELAVRPDDWIEKEHLRKLAATTAEEVCFDIFDTYKKAHAMESYT